MGQCGDFRVKNTTLMFIFHINVSNLFLLFFYQKSFFGFIIFVSLSNEVSNFIKFNQSETGIGEKKLLLELYDRVA